MRKADHQLIQPLYMLTFVKAAAKGGPKEAEDRHGGQRPRAGHRRAPGGHTSAVPTTCQMKRP